MYSFYAHIKQWSNFLILHNKIVFLSRILGKKMTLHSHCVNEESKSNEISALRYLYTFFD